MNPVRLAIRSLFHFWRSNLSIAFGVAAATAVLTGALIVGDSMRGSLRDLTLQRLAGVDEVLRGRAYFRQQLAEEIATTDEFRETYELAVPAIVLPNSMAQIGEDLDQLQVVSVALYGCTDEFWILDVPENRPERTPKDQEIILNRTLADDLGIESVHPDRPVMISVRLPVQGRIAGDSVLGEKEDLVEFIGDLKVIEIIEDRGLGRYSMYPTQLPPRNAFLSLELLQEILGPKEFKNKSDSNQVNVVFLKSKSDTRPPSADQTAALQNSIRPALADLDLRIKRVEQAFTPIESQPSEIVYSYFSISSDQMILPDEIAEIVEDAFPQAKPVFTYLANQISVDNPNDPSRPLPFSMITAIDFDDDFAPVSAITQQPVARLPEDGIVLNQWAADRLGARVGDTIEVKYFEPETTDGDEVEKSIQLKLVDIVKLVEPLGPFRNRRNGELIKPGFDKRPTLANDPDLTPEVPGLTDAKSVDSWDLPFETPGITAEDDDYWQYYRTTPKAFVSLDTGRTFWASRFGSTTSYRIKIRGRDREQIEQIFLDKRAERDPSLGLDIVPVKRHGLAASSGSTPFDVLFLSLSMFVIVAALLLVSILFRLSLQQRSNQIGILAAVGIRHRRITRIWTIEMLFVSMFGAIIGIILGVGYAALMILGLRTRWVGAISTPFIQLHVGWLSILAGAFAGATVCLITIWFSIWLTRKHSVRALLSGRIESTAKPVRNPGRKLMIASLVSFLLGLAFTVVATQLAGESQAGAFLGGGFCVLLSLLILVWNGLRMRPGKATLRSLNVTRLAFQNTRRSPLRSTLTISLVAAASFLIVAISAFRLTPTEKGTAGFQWLATTERPIFEDLNDPVTQKRGLLKQELASDSLVLPMRLKSGEDASCNNPYQSTQPKVIGVSSQFIKYFDDPSSSRKKFGWAATAARSEEEKANPWQLLTRNGNAAAIPVVIDKNTAWYSLKVYFVGSEFEVEFDSGEKATFKVVGFLDNTILQGSLIIGEVPFRELFKDSSGYQMFLMNLDSTEKESGSDLSVVKNRLSDYGLDMQSSEKLLSGYLGVQNTYLSTFQALGALGLLLGTFGLAAVQLRSILERKQELALMRATGFTPFRLGQYVTTETILLLVEGLAIGAIAAMFATLPHAVATQISFPWLESGIMFATIFAVGLLTSLIAARWVTRVPILSALRN